MNVHQNARLTPYRRAATGGAGSSRANRSRWPPRRRRVRHTARKWRSASRPGVPATGWVRDRPAGLARSPRQMRPASSSAPSAAPAASTCAEIAAALGVSAASIAPRICAGAACRGALRLEPPPFGRALRARRRRRLAASRHQETRPHPRACAIASPSAAGPIARAASAGRSGREGDRGGLWDSFPPRHDCPRRVDGAQPRRVQPRLPPRGPTTPTVPPARRSALVHEFTRGATSLLNSRGHQS